MNRSRESVTSLFMAGAPSWYKTLIAGFLIVNLPIYFIFGPFVTGWVVLTEFLIVLIFSLQSYPLFPGGLLALEALFLKMVTVEGAMKEIHANLDIIMLLIFLVPAIYFMKPLLRWIFMRIFSLSQNKVVLSLVFLLVGAFLSAWLDALTVIAVMISVCAGAEQISTQICKDLPEDAEEFKGVLRNLLMHGAMGTALGGVATLIGEPQNLLIGHYAGWQFTDFYLNMARFSIPLQIAGIVLCLGLEFFRVRFFGFGYQIPKSVGTFLRGYSKKAAGEMGVRERTRLLVMACLFICLTLALAFQIAPIGIIGLGMLICLPVLTGQANEDEIGKAFEEPLPFTALLVVFFVIVAMMDLQGLLGPVAKIALGFTDRRMLYSFFFASGILSSVSDNVFVAAVYIQQATGALTQGIIDKARFDHVARMINLGTNIFSVVTPNGQAAFLFLLTSAMGRRIGLSYVRMIRMAFPYAVIFVLTALFII